MDVRLFDMKRAQRHMKLSVVEVQKLIEFFIQRGTIQRHVRDDTVLYAFVKPQADGPVRRPKRTPPEVLVGGSESAARGRTVAYTGRPLGPSGKPGLDKRRKDIGKARKGRRGVK